MPVCAFSLSLSAALGCPFWFLWRSPSTVYHFRFVLCSPRALRRLIQSHIHAGLRPPASSSDTDAYVCTCVQDAAYECG
jgi:hypothetical protein